MSDGILTVQAEAPEEVRVGESFDVNLTITNSSDNVTLHDVKLRQKPSDGFSVDSVKSDKKSSDQQKSDNKKQSENAQQGNSSKMIQISSLGPGESKMVTINATADSEGQIKNCLEVVSYRPAMCLMVEATKPQLEITKSAPNKTNRCDVIELKYTIRNPGSGAIGALTVSDELGEGLVTIEGNDTLEFQVDGLEAGQERSFLGRVFAADPGEFGSRAMAKANNSDLQAKSKKTTTKVIAADLRVRVKGPKQLLAGQPATFTASVTNTGNAPADDVALTVQIPADATLVSISEPSMVESEGNKESGKNQNVNMPTVANKNDSQQSQNDSGNNESDIEMVTEALALGRLNAGQTAEFEYIVRPESLEELPTKVVAAYVCDLDPAVDKSEVEQAKITAEAMARAEVVRLPALQLVALDGTDPVPVDGETTYVIRVTNEGNAPDQDLRVTATLPEGLKYVDAKGLSKAKNNGQEVKFEPIEEIAAGDSVEFRIMAKSDGSNEGNVTFQVEVESKNREKAIQEDEATTLFAN